MKDLQHLINPQNVGNQEVNNVTKHHPTIPTKYKSTANLSRLQYPMCLACKLATKKSKYTDVVRNEHIVGKEVSLSCNLYEPGDCISTNQFIVKTPGRIQKGYGQEAAQNCSHGGTIFQDTASDLVRVQPQVSLGAGETVIGKLSFEYWIQNFAGVMAKRYHSDNVIFIQNHFRSHCQGKKQTQYLSGVGAKHQNGKVDREIQTISYWYRKMINHTALHWEADNADIFWLWALEVDHAAWLYNYLQKKNLGWMSPVDIFTKTQNDHFDMRKRFWGCPALVLHPKLQGNQKLPKFIKRIHMGQLLGFSDEHSTLISIVRNLATDFVRPKFHVVFDEKFSTIQNDNRLEGTAVEAIFNDILTNCRDFYGEEGCHPKENISDLKGAAVEAPPPPQVRW